MRLLNTLHGDIREFLGANVPNYAILSHRWEEDEVTLKDMQNGTADRKRGYWKVNMASKLAMLDGWGYVWIDTCCIDTSSSAELSEAINSMFDYYAKADICYVFLTDVDADCHTSPSERKRILENKNRRWHDAESVPMTLEVQAAFRSSSWFQRGWTLQELVAPKIVRFYDRSITFVGDKFHLADILADITGIDCEILKDPSRLTDVSTADRLSWAASRVTTRTEDRAYCLLGLLGVSMPLLYGEGEKCFARLQEEIARTRRPTRFEDFFVMPRRKCFFHVYVDSDFARIEATSPPIAWTLKNNTALVVTETGRQLACEIVVEDSTLYVLEFQDRVDEDLSVECRKLPNSSITGNHTAGYEYRNELGGDTSTTTSIESCPMAVVTASEIKCMRRHDTRVFTIIVSFEANDHSSDVKLFDKPSTNNNDVPPMKKTQAPKTERNRNNLLKNLRYPSIHWTKRN